MNMKSIYANPYKYACQCNIPIELAKATTHEEWIEFAIKIIIGRRPLK